MCAEVNRRDTIVARQAPSSVADLAALRSVGFTAAPTVSMAQTVLLPPIFDTVGMAVQIPMGGVKHRVDVLVRTRRAALDALGDWANQAGVAGLVGVQFYERDVPARTPTNRVGEYVEVAVTAVPVFTAGGPTSCFRTAIDPPGVAVLLKAGWAPVDVLVASVTQTLSMKHRHGDAMAATSRRNAELPGPTDMIERARRGIARQFARSAAALGADGVLLHGRFEVTWTSTYHLVQVAATANAIAQWGRVSTATRRTLPLV
jgi:uncharacterized protein YbjQ (UPF0145 family)